MENPIDILSNQDDMLALSPLSRRYLVRPVLGSMATAMIGAARQIINETVVEDGGIDDPVIANLMAERQTLDGIWGYDAPMRPQELLARVKSLRVAIAMAVDPTDETSDIVVNALLNMNDTFKFMCEIPTYHVTDHLKTYAESIGLRVEDMLAEQQKQAIKRVAKFRDQREQIVEIIDDTPGIEGEFEELPINNQIRIFESVEKALIRGRANAAKTFFLQHIPDADRSSEGLIYANMLLRMKQWSDQMMRVNPDFALRRLGL